MPLTIWNCVLSYQDRRRIISVKMGMFFQEIISITEFPDSYQQFKQVANGIFRWQICYLLLLILNPDLQCVQYAHG